MWWKIEEIPHQELEDWTKAVECFERAEHIREDEETHRSNARRNAPHPARPVDRASQVVAEVERAQQTVCDVAVDEGENDAPGDDPGDEVIHRASTPACRVPNARRGRLRLEPRVPRRSLTPRPVHR